MRWKLYVYILLRGISGFSYSHSDLKSSVIKPIALKVTKLYFHIMQYIIKQKIKISWLSSQTTTSHYFKTWSSFSPWNKVTHFSHDIPFSPILLQPSLPFSCNVSQNVWLNVIQYIFALKTEANEHWPGPGNTHTWNWCTKPLALYAPLIYCLTL
jgi:hypothetical protein